MSYFRKHGEKIIKRCKKHNYRILERYNYNEIEGFVYSYVLQDYNGKNTLEIADDRTYFLIEQHVKKLENKEAN